MKVLLYAAAIFVFIFLVRVLSFLVKRFAMYAKLKSECKKIGATLTGTHLFWILACRKSRYNDCYIEIHNKIYSVKLFSSNSRRKILIFTGRGSYFFRKYLGFIANTGARAVFSKDSKPKKMPAYYFQKNFREEWYLKELVSVLLICPYRYDVLCQTKANKLRSIDAGELIDNMMIVRFSDFIRHVRGVSYEHSQFNHHNKRKGN